MRIYQRYLSKSLIFFASFIFLIIFFLESNFGFKLFFNITNYFFLGIKTAEISGNWRDFKLQKIAYNCPGISIKSANIHILIDPLSLFKVQKIFKKVEIKSLILSFHQNSLVSFGKESIKKNILEKNIFFSKYIILQHIHADKIVVQSKNIHILLSNVYSGLKLINNNVTILHTNMDFICLNCNKNYHKYFSNTKNMINKKKINNFLSFFLNQKKILLPVNINLTFIKCKKIKFFHQELKNILFQGSVYDQFKFKLQFNDFLKFHVCGKVLLNDVYHPMYISLYIHHLALPINKKLITAKNFHMILKGTVDNYNLSVKNTINISGIPSVFLNIFGSGHLTNIALNKIYFIPDFSSFKHNKVFYLKKENYMQYLSKLSGNINIANNFNQRINSINIPSFNVQANIIDRKLLIFGALYYNQINNIKIPRINFVSGKNTGFLTGSISKSININSSINANNLDYFVPNLKGIITATLNIYGYYFSPMISGVLLGEKLSWNHMIYLNNIKMLIDINNEKKFKKNVSLAIKKIKFLKFYLDYLNLKIYCNNINQKFYFDLKSKNFTINFVLNSKFNDQTGVWKGIFKKINIVTFNTKWVIKNKPFIFFFSKKNMKISANQIKYKHTIYSKIYIFQKFLLSSVFNSSINLKTNLFFYTKLISQTKKTPLDIKIFLFAKNIKLQKKIKDKIFLKKISFLKFFLNFKKNNLITHWIIYPSKNKNKKLFGFLNIFDFLHQQNIQGKYFLIDFPIDIVNFFIPHSTILAGTCTGNIKFLGTVYQPNILADIHLKNFYIKSNKILKYIILFFCPSLNFVKYIKIHQLIFIKQGDMLFKLYLNSTNNILRSIEWNIFLNSNQVFFYIFRKMKLNFTSQLNLHYFLLKYDLIGYLKSNLFYFKINEKNFIF